MKNPNRLFFGLGTLGRDMFYTTVSMYLIFYLTDVLNLSDATMGWVTLVLTILRVFDALNDPLMGMVVDNTRSRYGKFKPGILVGGLTGAVFMVLMFTDLGLTGARYLIAFALFYLAWDLLYGWNDIAYWSMLPSLSLEQKEREVIGTVARLCGAVGMYFTVVGIVPITNAAAARTGSLKSAWTCYAVFASVMMLLFQLFTLLGVRERRGYFKQEDRTTLRGMARAVAGNDQLLYVTLAMGLFMVGFSITTTFGLYYFKYIFGNENMYSVFAVFLGAGQLTSMGVFPLLVRRIRRKTLYGIAIALIVLGYGVFFAAGHSLFLVGLAGILMFIGQGFIQMLMLMFLSDTVEYGQWKMGRRNESVTFSLQPVIAKLGGAIASGVVGLTLIVSGINSAESARDVTVRGASILKFSMFVIPVLLIVLGYLVYLKKYRIDEKRFADIVDDLRKRGQIGG